MGANIAVFVLSYFNNKLIYLYLDEADNGIVFLIMRFTLFLSLFFGDWLRLSSMNIAGNDKRTIPVLSANSFWYSVILGLVLTLVALLLPSLYNGTILGVPSPYIPVTLIVGLAYIARNNWQSLLLVSHRMFNYSFVFILWAVLFLVLNIIFLVFLGYGINYVLAALSIASVASALWAFGSSIFTCGHTFHPSLKILSMSGKIGARAWIAVLGMFLLANIHAFSIKPFAGSGEEGWIMVALFSVGYRVFSVFQRGADVAGAILYSHVVQQDDKTSFKMTMMVTRNIILIMVFFAVLTALAGKALIIIISSSKYITAYIPMLVMLPGMVAVNAGSVINNYYWGRTYPFKIISAPYVAVVIGMALNYILIPRMGLSGAALSFSLMNVMWFMFETTLFLRDSGYKMHEVLIPRLSDVIHVMRRFNQKLPGQKKR